MPPRPWKMLLPQRMDGNISLRDYVELLCGRGKVGIVSSHVLISCMNTSKSVNKIASNLRCVSSADQNMAAHNRPLSGMFGQPNFFRSAVFSAILQVRIEKLVLQKLFANAGVFRYFANMGFY